MHHYSEEFKRSIIQKTLLPGGPSLASMAKENGLILTTVYGWKKKYANHSLMKNQKKWTAEKKLQVIIETISLNENELGEFWVNLRVDEKPLTFEARCRSVIS